LDIFDFQVFVQALFRFLDSLERQENIEPWQVKQAGDSLAFLYRGFLKPDLRVKDKSIE